MIKPEDMSVPALLRLAAMLLRWNGVTQEELDEYTIEQDLPAFGKSGSGYICDVLGNLGELCERSDEASDWLLHLGMGCGFGVFGPPNFDAGGTFTLEQQHQRMAWLFFAADLWEEFHGY